MSASWDRLPRVDLYPTPPSPPPLTLPLPPSPSSPDESALPSYCPKPESVCDQKPIVILPGIETIMNTLSPRDSADAESTARQSRNPSEETVVEVHSQTTVNERPRKRKRSLSPRRPDTSSAHSSASSSTSHIHMEPLRQTASESSSHIPTRIATSSARLLRPTASTPPSHLPAPTTLMEGIRQYWTGPVGQGNRFLIRSNLKYRRSNDTVYVSLEMPGVQVEDIKLTLTVNSSSQKTLDVLVVVPPPVVEPGEYLREERVHGRMTRSFVVPNHIGPNDIHTDLKDGLFHIEIRGTHSETVAIRRESISPAAARG